MVRTLRRSPLDTNLTKWLSKCEGWLHKSKRKRQLQGEYDANKCEIKEHGKENQIRIVECKNETKQEHNTKSKSGMTNGRREEGRRNLMWWIWEREHVTWNVIGLQDKCC